MKSEVKGTATSKRLGNTALEERPGQMVVITPLLITKTLCYSEFDNRVTKATLRTTLYFR